MKVLGARSLASRLRLVLDILLIVTLVTGALNALLMLGLLIEPTSPARRLLNLTTLFTVPPGFCDSHGLLLQRDPGALVETQLLAFVNYRPGSRWGLLGIAAGSYVLWGMYVGVLLQLRRVFDSLTSGQPFLRSNVRRLRIIGWTIIAAVSFKHAWGWAAYACLRSALTLAGRAPTLPIAFVIDDIHPEVFFVGAAVLVLAEIFRVGASLQEEQALTV